jgi:sulfatase modifying factor 1
MRCLRSPLVPLAMALPIALAAACAKQPPARAQWTVRVSTDAPVPQFGDRVLVELLTLQGASACDGCTRSFGPRTNADWPLSFGITDPGTGEAFRLRVRLFRTDHTTAGGLPSGGAPLDFLGELPATGGGIRAVETELLMRCVGVPASVTDGRSCVADGSIATRTVPDDHGTIVTPAAPTPACTTPVPAGMVCVAGGFFHLGSDNAVGLATASNVLTDPAPERVVQLSPFAIDLTEVTVAAIRPLVAAGTIGIPKHTVDRYNPKDCNYIDATGAHDSYPVNCVDHDDAAKACAAFGKRLPTEAEWEYAAGNLGDESTYPWGEDDDYCSHAVVARGNPVDGDFDYCLQQFQIAGSPVKSGNMPVAQNTGDATALGILHMGGNVAEWVLDSAHGYGTDGCLGDARVLVNPRCTIPYKDPGAAADIPPGYVFRGASWLDEGFATHVTLRATDNEENTSIGFRCAKDL